MTARIEVEWLLDLFPDHVWEQSSVAWNRVAERIEAVSALLYDDLVIQDSRGAVPEAEAAADLLWQKALEVGIERFVDGGGLEQFQRESNCRLLGNRISRRRFAIYVRDFRALPN